MRTHPKAHKLQVWKCGDPECIHPHLVLYNSDGTILAEAVMGPSVRDQIENFPDHPGISTAPGGREVQ